MNKVVGIIIAAVVMTSVVAAQRGREGDQPAAQSERQGSAPAGAARLAVELISRRPGGATRCSRMAVSGRRYRVRGSRRHEDQGLHQRDHRYFAQEPR